MTHEYGPGDSNGKISREEAERADRRAHTRLWLDAIAQTEPEIGMPIFHTFRTSVDPSLRQLAASIIPDIFTDEQMLTDPAVLALRGDPDPGVRAEVQSGIESHSLLGRA
jgi:hypothetical protein